MKLGFGPEAVLSCADAVAKAMENAINTPIEITTIATKQLSVETFIKAYEQKDSGRKKVANGACPECGSPMEYVEGCNMCYSCGHSQCS